MRLLVGVAVVVVLLLLVVLGVGAVDAAVAACIVHVSVFTAGQLAGQNAHSTAQHNSTGQHRKVVVSVQGLDSLEARAT